MKKIIFQTPIFNLLLVPVSFAQNNNNENALSSANLTSRMARNVMDIGHIACSRYFFLLRWHTLPLFYSTGIHAEEQTAKYLDKAIRFHSKN